MKRFAIISTVIFILLSACAPAAAAPTVTPVPTAAPTATAVPTEPVLFEPGESTPVGPGEVVPKDYAPEYREARLNDLRSVPEDVARSRAAMAWFASLYISTGQTRKWTGASMGDAQANFEADMRKLSQERQDYSLESAQDTETGDFIYYLYNKGTNSIMWTVRADGALAFNEPAGYSDVVQTSIDVKLPNSTTPGFSRDKASGTWTLFALSSKGEPVNRLVTDGTTKDNLARQWAEVYTDADREMFKVCVENNKAMPAKDCSELSDEAAMRGDHLRQAKALAEKIPKLTEDQITLEAVVMESTEHTGDTFLGPDHHPVKNDTSRFRLINVWRMQSKDAPYSVKGLMGVVMIEQPNGNRGFLTVDLGQSLNDAVDNEGRFASFIKLQVKTDQEQHEMLKSMGITRGDYGSQQLLHYDQVKELLQQFTDTMVVPPELENIPVVVISWEIAEQLQKK